MADSTIGPRATFCKVCNAPFTARDAAAAYCSPRCRRQWGRRIEHQKRAEARLARGAIKLGENFPCRGCGVAVIAAGPAAKFCEPCGKVAQAARYKRWNEAHPEKRSIIEKAVKLRQKNCPRYQAWYRDYRREYTKIRRKADPRYTLDIRMGQQVRRGLGASKGGRHWENLVGYSLPALAVHIERQFSRGMSWKNMGEWHIDHIIPRSMFSYATPDEPEFRACWAITNLRPLWARENVAKGRKRLFLI